jgi:hypothetical protein
VEPLKRVTDLGGKAVQIGVSEVSGQTATDTRRRGECGLYQSSRTA